MTRQAKLAAEVADGPDATLNVGRWVRRLAAEELGADGAFAQSLGDGPALPAWAGFGRDLFGELYGLGVKSAADVAPGSEWIDRVLGAARELPEWRALAARAEGDPWRCGLAAGETIAALDEVLRELAEQLPEDLEEKLQRAVEAEAALEQAIEETGAEPGELRDLERAAADADTAAEQAAAQAAQALEAALGGPEGQARLRKALRAGAAAGERAAEEVEAAMAGLGQGSGAGALSAVRAPAEQVRAALRRDSRLMRIAQIAGRLRLSARKAQQAKRVEHAREEVVDVETGSDVQRLLPSEFAQLGDEDLELAVMRRLVEGQAMQYRLAGRERAERGPLLVLIDGSGSMNGARHEWACGVALALLEVAARQRRAFSVWHFDTGVRACFDFVNPRAVKLEEVLRAVSFFSGGGTSVQAALGSAAERVKAEAARAGKLRHADVVLISDGESGDFTAAVEALRKLDTAVYGIGIAAPFSPRNVAALAGYEQITDTQIEGGAEGSMTRVLSL